MALATGTEAPATSIAQLGQLDERRPPALRARDALAMTIFIVGALTLGDHRARRSPARRHPARPGPKPRSPRSLGRQPEDGGKNTSISPAATAAGSQPASSFQAGPGLLKALARTSPDGEDGFCRGSFGRTIAGTHTPVSAVIVYAVHLGGDHFRGRRPGAGAGAGLRGGRLRQLFGRAAWRWPASRIAAAFVSLPPRTSSAAVAVAFTLAVEDVTRGYPLLALAGTVLVAAGLYVRWVRAGRPTGIEAVEREAEADD